MSFRSVLFSYRTLFLDATDFCRLLTFPKDFITEPYDLHWSLSACRLEVAKPPPYTDSILTEKYRESAVCVRKSRFIGLPSLSLNISKSWVASSETSSFSPYSSESEEKASTDRKASSSIESESEDRA